MSARVSLTSTRAARLRLRCIAQREQLAQELAEIERRIYSADSLLITVRNVVVKPTFVLGTLAMLVLGRQRYSNKWWSLFRGGLFWFSTGRRLYQTFKRR